jgi:heme exporter protein C
MTEKSKSHGRGLRRLATATTITLVGSFAMVFFWTPNEADQGFIQKIFYLHVPLAIVTLFGFVLGGIFGFMQLRTGSRIWDLRSYVAIHLSLMLAVAVLITGAIWAKASWGHWWVWDEPVLVSFLVIFLLYACYQPLRFAIEDPDRQARYAAVFAVVAGAFVPINFAAVRLAQAYTHPRTLGTTAGGMPQSMTLTFLACLISMTLLFITLWKFELTNKSARMKLSSVKRRIEREINQGQAA